MPFEDFKRSWMIQESTVACQPPQIVRITGKEDAVIVLCGDVPYDPGKYLLADPEKGKVERIKSDSEDVYQIVFIERDPKTGKKRIQAQFKGGQIGGTWIAEDNGGTEDPE